MGRRRGPKGGQPFLFWLIDSYSNASRIPPSRFVWVVRLLSCWVCVCVCAGLWVCVFLFFSFVVRLVWGCLCTFWRVLGLFWGPFLSFGGALGSVLTALGVPWVTLGVLGGRFGRPGGPKSNFLTFFPPILRSFLLHFGAQNRCKI